jgi:hypothetical protein
MDDLIVTIDHVRAVRHNGQALCARGVRAWCQQAGIDYARVLREGGIRATELEQVDDHFARLVLAKAREISGKQQ